MLLLFWEERSALRRIGRRGGHCGFEMVAMEVLGASIIGALRGLGRGEPGIVRICGYVFV